MVAPGEIYGRGLVYMRFPDIKTLNKVIELNLKNASISIGGVFTAVDDGVFNPQTLKIQPGAIIGVSSNGGIEAFFSSTCLVLNDPSMSSVIAQEYRMNIKKILLDESLPPDNMSARTATEIVERMKGVESKLRCCFGRLISETMYPIVRRTLELMDEEKIIDLADLKVNGKEISIEPQSPLARANNMEKVQNVLQFMQIAQSFGSAGFGLIKPEKVGDYILDQMGIDASLRTTPEERQAILQQIQARQQAQAQAEMQQAQQAQRTSQESPTEQPIEEGVTPDEAATLN